MRLPVLWSHKATIIITSTDIHTVIRTVMIMAIPTNMTMTTIIIPIRMRIIRTDRRA